MVVTLKKYEYKLIRRRFGEGGCECRLGAVAAGKLVRLPFGVLEEQIGHFLILS